MLLRVYLPPTPPAPDGWLELHDAELVRLRFDDFGRRVTLAMIVCGGDDGRYQQPVEVVLEDFDRLFWVDEIEDGDGIGIMSGGPSGREYHYGRVDDERGFDYTVRSGAMNLTVVRVRRMTTTALRALPPPSLPPPSLPDGEGGTPMDIEDVREHMYDRRSGEGGLRIESLELQPEERTLAVRFATEPPWTAHAAYAGISTMELERVTPSKRSDVLGAAVQRKYADSLRLWLAGMSMRLSLVGRDWRRSPGRARSSEG